MMEDFKVMKHYFMFVYIVYSLKMVSTKKTTEACDWVIGTHISDK